MRLIQISSNKPTFKPVKFRNKSGLNIIVATRTQDDEQDKTSNGVGKSLLVALIRFCLGSETPIDFKNKLFDWIFTLEFSIGETNHNVTRLVSKPKKVVFNSIEIGVDEFREQLTNLVFDIPADIPGLTFGSLSPFFIRPRKQSYVDILNPNGAFTPYDTQIINAFLMGLNTLLVKNKKALRDKIETNKSDIKRLKSDDTIRDFLLGNKDAKLEKEKLKKEISERTDQLQKLEIAQDYYHVKIKADNTKQRIDDIQNEIEICKVQIQNIEKSLELKADLKKDKIIDIYEESKALFSTETLKTLDQLELFYETISKNRNKRLSSQKQEIDTSLQNLEIEKEKLCKDLDDFYKYLDTHQALEVYKSVTTMLNDAKAKLEKIESFDNLLASLDLTKATLREDLAKENLKTVAYLQSNEFAAIESDNNTFFTDVVKWFYPNAGARVSIENNEGDNQSRYNFNLKIDNDNSDGISNIELFCYDLMLLMMEYNHRMAFIFHDSRILDGVDSRQTYKLFKLADRYFKDADKQYIITVNYNQLNAVKDEIINNKDISEPEKEYKQLIEDNIIHRLGDEGPEQKLLGIQIDLNYEKTK